MKVIWKLTLTQWNPLMLTMPEGAEILTVQEQFNEPQIWFLCDSEAKIEQRTFIVIGTGSGMPESIFVNIKKYIGTYQTDGGNYVYHLFELKTK